MASRNQPADPDKVQAAVEQAERGAAAPKQADPEDDVTGPVLLFNARGGIYQATIAKPLPRAQNDLQQRYEHLFLRVPPGLLLVRDLDLWRAVRSSPGLQRRIDDGEIQLLEGSRTIRPHDTWRRMKPRQAVERVKGSADVQTLQDLLELEERPEVRQALEEQIAECTSDGEQRSQQKQAQRRAQRAHHRAMRGRSVAN